MSKVRSLLLVCLLFFSFLLVGVNDVKAEEKDNYLLNPVVKYEFNEGALGADSMNGYDLTIAGNPTAGEKGVVLNGNSYLYMKALNGYDITDALDSFTVTVWAKEASIGAGHRFMIGTGVAYSVTGFGMGFYSTNSAYIVPSGAADGYASNFVTSSSDSFGPHATNYNTSLEWNLYTLMVKEGTLSYGVNGYLYTIPQTLSMNTIRNLTQTFTVGAVCSNDGSGVNNLFNGEIADVRIYNDFLSADEFKAIYDNGIGGAECVYRNVDISSIQNSSYTDANPYDFEVPATSTKLTENSILTAVKELDVKVKLSDDSVVSANVVPSKIEIKASEAIVTGVLDVTGVSNSKSVKVKVRVYMNTDAQITVNTTFTDHMVLQRNEKVKIFGYGGSEGGVVTVSYNGQTKTGVVGENGWSVYLDPMAAKATGSDLVITYKNQTITYTDVVVGEVLLCSGQSNMDITLQYIMNKNSSVYREYNEFSNYDKIRFLDIPYVESTEPKIYESPIARWTTVNSIADCKSYSAYALAAASHYQAILGDEVPVGVIKAAVGGSCIEEWLDPASMKNLNSYAASMNKVDSRYYNAYIYNLAGYTLGGILWYQGCANSQPRMVADYIKQFNAYVSHYRTIFENNDLPIIVQQLVQHDSWVSLAEIRQAQWDFMKTHKNVYSIVGIDKGSMEPTDGIHPTDKWALGERVAAALALAKGMNKADFAVDNAYGVSPEIVSAKIETIDTGSRITFQTTADGKLKAVTGVTGFQVQVNGIWYDVEANVVNGIVVIETTYTNIKDIRYNFINGYDTQYGINRFVYNYEGVFIYDDENLPLAPSTKISYVSDSGDDQLNENNYQTLIKIEAKYEEMKLQYEVGEKVDYTGLYVVETYDNSEYDFDSVLTVTDLDNYTITVYDKDGNKVKGAFTEEGTYTVNVSAGKYSSSFEVNVGTTVDEPTTNPGETPAPTPTPEEPSILSKIGCGGSIVASLIGTLTLFGAALLLKKKKAN